MTLRLRWVATDDHGKRWELWNAPTKSRRHFVGRLIITPSGKVAVGLYERAPMQPPRWNEVRADSLRDGAVLLIAYAKKKPPTAVSK